MKIHKIYIITVLLWLMHIVVCFIPDGFVLRFSPNDPVYTPYTTWIFGILSLILYPVMLLCTKLHVRLLTPIYFTFTLFYSLFLAYFIKFIFLRKKKSKKKFSEEGEEEEEEI